MTKDCNKLEAEIEQEMIAEKFGIHRQCVECVKFIDGNCKGKAESKKAPAKYFGTTRNAGKKTGLNFCKEYEYDERLYVYPDKMPTYHSVKKEAVVKRKRKKKVKAEQKHADLVDVAQNLNLKDFEHLL